MNKIIFIVLVLSVLALAGCSKPQAGTCNIATGECYGAVKAEPAPEKTQEPEVKAEEKKQYDYKITAKEGELVKLKVNAEDADDKSLTYTYSQPFNQKGEWQTKRGDKGDYEVLITVSDGKNNAQSKVLVTVEEVPNNPPVVNVPELVEVNEGDTAAFAVDASDADNDKLIIAVFDERFVQKDRTFSWKTGYEDAGEYKVNVEVSDGSNSVKKVVTVKVNENKAPVITGISKG